jgi:hypothetical protein
MIDNTKVYVMDESGILVPKFPEEIFPTKQPTFSFWEKDWSWKKEIIKNFLLRRKEE